MMNERRSLLGLAGLLFLLVGAAVAQPDGGDIMIRDGTIVATAADYEMDGTMWTAFTRLEDSNVYIYRSTDHGLSWGYRSALGVWNEPMDRIGLVVGEGDSAFNCLFYLTNDNNGDLWVSRRNASSDSVWTFPVAYGPDTIRDFAVCRDYTGSNYRLYVVATNSDLPHNARSTRFLRSTNYGVQWERLDSLGIPLREPHLSAGAGSYIYLAARFADTLLLGINTQYSDPAHWHFWTNTMQDEIADPVIGAAFTLPESTAAIWCLWSQNYQNSGDWNIKYLYADGLRGWSQPDYLAGSSAVDEQYPDLRNYTSLGNQYINASYISDDDVYRSVYRRYANAANPTQWSDTLRINQGSAGTGAEIRPKLCYTPGGPFSGAGCVFVGAGLNGCWWNAPYPTGTAEPPGSRSVAAVLSVQPSISRGPFRVRCQEPAADLTVHDRSGRLVRTLAPDPTGVATWDGRDAHGRSLAHGVYFVRFTAGDYRATVKMVLQK